MEPEQQVAAQVAAPTPRTGPQSGTSSAAVTRALRESLELLASEVVASAILIDAIQDGGYERPPERVEELEAFVEGPLRAEATAVLGADAWDAIAEHLAPLLARMREAERQAAMPHGEAERQALRVSIRGSEAPKRRMASTPPRAAIVAMAITVVTDDGDLASSVAQRFAGVPLEICADVPPRAAARLLFVDTRRGKQADVVWSSATGPRLVVLWPAARDDRDAFARRHPHATEVIGVDAEGELDDVLLLLEARLRA
jgi:hypothetical protein